MYDFDYPNPKSAHFSNPLPPNPRTADNDRKSVAVSDKTSKSWTGLADIPRGSLWNPSKWSGTMRGKVCNIRFRYFDPIAYLPGVVGIIEKYSN